MILLAITAEDVVLAYGPLGVMAFAGIYLFRRIIAENDDLRAQRAVMIQTLLEVVPLIKKSTEIHEKRQQADELVKQQLDEIIEFIHDLGRELGMRR